MADRYALSDQRWHMIEDIVSPPQSIGRPRRDDRQMLDGIFWIHCSGAQWRDLPERYCPWKTVYHHFCQWRDDATFERVLTRLHLRLREDGLTDLDTRVIDSTSISATRSASGADKKGRSIEPYDHALGRSRGSLTTKIHLLCDRQSFPMAYCLSPSQQHADSCYFKPLLEQIRLPGPSGRPRKRSRHIIADKGYDSDDLRRYSTRRGMQSIIPSRRIHRRPRPRLAHQFDRPKYRQRNVVERVFGGLKKKRRFNMRYNKLAKSFRAMVTLASIECYMRANFSDRT